MRYALIFILFSGLFVSCKTSKTVKTNTSISSTVSVNSAAVRDSGDYGKGLTAGGGPPRIITSDDIEFSPRTLQELKKKDYEIVLSYEPQDFLLKTDSWWAVDNVYDYPKGVKTDISPKNWASRFYGRWFYLIRLNGNEMKCVFQENKDSVERRMDVRMAVGEILQWVHFIQHPNHQKGKDVGKPYPCICKTSKSKAEKLKMAQSRIGVDKGLRREEGMGMTSVDVVLHRVSPSLSKSGQPYEIKLSYKPHDFVLRTAYGNWSIEDVYDYPGGEIEDVSPRFAASRFYGSWFHLDAQRRKNLKCVFQENKDSVARRVEVRIGNKDRYQWVYFIQHANPQRGKDKVKR